MLRRVLRKLYRRITYRNRVYGVIGKGNRFSFGVYVHESAVIGKNNYIGPYTMINNATIGNYCSIAPSVKIGQANHSKDYITTYNNISSKLIGFTMYEKPALIENDVWIGANAVIMQGVKVGNGVVIGANAVVNTDIPPYAIAVGIPAKVVKFRFTKENIAIIEDSKWFHYDLAKAKHTVLTLHKQLGLDVGQKVKSNEIKK